MPGYKKKTHLTKMLIVLTESFSAQQLNVFSPSSQESLLPKKNQIIKASAFAKVVAQFHCHSLSLCSDLTDHCLSMQLCTCIWMENVFFPSPPR